MKKQKDIVWSNMNLAVDDGWKESYIDFMDINEIPYDEDNISEADVYNYMIETNDEYLDDERANLNEILPNGIIVIADLGFWDGRRHGYKEIISGNIADCLSDDCDYCEWYCDRYDFRFTGHHHDGSNHYIYMTWADGISEQSKENYLEKIYSRKDTHADMLKYTRSIRPYIAKIYGWK